MFAEGIGLQRNELYKMIIGLLVDKHLDYVCEHETNIDNDTLDALRINRRTNVSDDIDSQFDYPSSDWCPTHCTIGPKLKDPMLG